MKLNIIRKVTLGALFCLCATLSSSLNSYATVAPIYFTDDTTNSSNTIVHIGGTPVAGNSYVYSVSPNSSPVPTPNIGVDDLSLWGAIIDGQSIAAANGQHIGIAEINESNIVVDFRDSVAVNLAEVAAPTVSVDDSLNMINGIDKTMEFSVDDGDYVMYDGSNLPNLAGNHTVKLRVAAVANVSNASEAVSLTFVYANAAPAAPSVAANDTLNTITGINTTMEFSVDGGDYVMYDGTNLPDLTGRHFVSVRIADNIATDTPTGDIKGLFFTEDNTLSVSGVTDGAFYNSDVVIRFSGSNFPIITLDDAAYASELIVSSEGPHVLAVADLINDIAMYNFVIDKTAPSVSGVSNGATYDHDVVINYSDINIASATLNGSNFTNGGLISAERSYALVVTDLAGNKTEVDFTITAKKSSIVYSYTPTSMGGNGSVLAVRSGQASSVNTDEEIANSDSENINDNENGSTFAWLLTTVGVVIVAFAVIVGVWSFIKKHK